MKTIRIPVKGSDTFDMLKTRGYVSVRNGNLYHKFHSYENFERWFTTGEIECAWGESVWELIKKNDICSGNNNRDAGWVALW